MRTAELLIAQYGCSAPQVTLPAVAGLGMGERPAGRLLAAQYGAGAPARGGWFEVGVQVQAHSPRKAAWYGLTAPRR